MNRAAFPCKYMWADCWHVPKLYMEGKSAFLTSHKVAVAWIKNIAGVYSPYWAPGTHGDNIWRGLPNNIFCEENIFDLHIIRQEMFILTTPFLCFLPSSFLSVLNAFKFPLLIGIGLATLIGLLSCLIGYCSSRWCCKKEVQETRRERRRLMSMEMD